MNITYKYMLVFIDCFSKMRHLVFIISMKVEEVINSFYAHVWKHHDLLKFFMSDRDTQFIFDVWKHICKMLKINVKLFTTYYFEINDQIERFNAVIKHYLRVYVNYMQDDWAKWLFEVEFVIVIVIVIVIHTFLWHRFRLDSWETLCYLYRVNKTLWERKSLVVYTTALRSRNNEIDTVLPSNESIASIQHVMLE